MKKGASNRETLYGFAALLMMQKTSQSKEGPIKLSIIMKQYTVIKQNYQSGGEEREQSKKKYKKTVFFYICASCIILSMSKLSKTKVLSLLPLQHSDTSDCCYFAHSFSDIIDTFVYFCFHYTVFFFVRPPSKLCSHY